MMPIFTNTGRLKIATGKHRDEGTGNEAANHSPDTAHRVPDIGSMLRGAVFAEVDSLATAIDGEEFGDRSPRNVKAETRNRT